MTGSSPVAFCPACGFGLGFEPWDGDSASDEICPCCRIQFGYNDARPGGPPARREFYREWRRAWIAEGTPWRGATAPPPGWDPQAQLLHVAV